MKKNILLFTVMIMVSLTSFAQHRKKFDPNQFKSDLHAYIIKEAELTAQEQVKFFPVYDEMLDKQRDVFDTLRKLLHQKNVTDAQAKQIILRSDLLESRLKQIERNYHSRMMRIIPASKLLRVFRAERRFHRQTLMKFAKKDY